MKWPWVRREELDRVLAFQRAATVRAVRAERRHASLLEKYHELASRSPALAPAAPEPVDVPQPDVPPPAVLEAMQRISPIKDKAFEANWAFWEAHKEQAAQHPDAFAQDILNGVVEP